MRAIPVVMPHMGQSIAEGTVVKWHRSVGEQVAADELLVEVESDKVAFEVGSPAGGVLTACLKEEGDVADVGTPIGTVETEQDVPISHTTIAAEPAAEPDSQAPPDETARPEVTARSVDRFPRELPEITQDWLSPSVSRLAILNHVSMAELRALKGSGHGGRVTRQDLLEYLSRRGAGPTQKTPDGDRASVDIDQLKQHGHVIPMTAIRRSIADHMVQSIHTSAHVTMVHAMDATHLVTLRERTKAEFRAQHGVKLTYTGVMIYLTGRLLRAFPNINASTFGTYILQRDAINVGCAVALPDESLVVPVIRNADTRSLPEIAIDLDRLVQLARDRHLTREDVEGGTFTISNFGTFGTLFGTPIINQPQVAILGMGAITKEPVYVNESWLPRDTLYLSFSFDHRVVDGAMAGRFFNGLQKSAGDLTAEDVLGTAT